MKQALKKLTQTLLLLTVLLGGIPALAGGLLVVLPDNTAMDSPMSSRRVITPLELRSENINVEINSDSNTATTTVKQVFYNPSERDVEGSFMLPLPTGSVIDSFKMNVNGEMTEMELLKADAARKIYEDIVRQARDPALLEYVGRDLFKVRIFPIQAKKESTIELTYTETLNNISGLSEYNYSFGTGKHSSVTPNNVAINITIEGSKALRTIYPTTLDCEVIRSNNDKRAVIGFEKAGFQPDQDFKLLFSITDQTTTPSFDLIPLPVDASEGFFYLALYGGQPDSSKEKIVKKNIIFVIDTSGSMSGGKLEQAQQALAFCLDNLNDGDNFEVVRFSTEAEPLFGELRNATVENRQQAGKFVKDLRPAGGTAIYEALEKTLKQADASANKDNQTLIVFLTDGEATVGPTSNNDINAMVKKNLTDNVRIFCFGIGYSINTHLLDTLAEYSGTQTTYVTPNENLELKVTSFYQQIRFPSLANLTLSCEGAVKLLEIFPNTLPDLFAGSTQIILGRYQNTGNAVVKISGQRGTEEITLTKEVTFPVAVSEQFNRDFSFIPRLWASRRIGYLLDQIRRNGDQEELREEIIKLARKYAIITPYTSGLILEDQERRKVGAEHKILAKFSEFDRAVMKDYNESLRRESASRQDQVGQRAVQNAAMTQTYKSSYNLADTKYEAPVMSSTMAGVGGMANMAAGTSSRPSPYARSSDTARNVAESRQISDQVQNINSRNFYNQNNRWVEEELLEVTLEKPWKGDIVVVEFAGEAYFELIRKYPELAPYLSLGEEVDFIFNKQYYQIRNQKETL